MLSILGGPDQRMAGGKDQESLTLHIIFNSQANIAAHLGKLWIGRPTAHGYLVGHRLDINKARGLHALPLHIIGNNGKWSTDLLTRLDEHAAPGVHGRAGLDTAIIAGN